MAPVKPDWLNVDFVQKVLRNAEKDESIEVTDLSTKAATATGDNYTSDMIRATVEYSRNKSGRKVTEKMSLIVKISPTTDGLHKEMIEEIGLFDKEIRMMETTLQSMNKLLSDENWRLGARVLYTEKGSQKTPSLLVIEDLAPLGFRMADRQAGLDFSHSILALRGLAKFHATSVALCEKDPTMKETYRKGCFHKEQPEGMVKFFQDGMRTFSKEVVNWPELDPIYSEKIGKLVDVAYSKACEAAQQKDGEFHVMNHGDSWVNNMLFRYNDEGKPTHHIFCDFQLCVWSSPAVDLMYFLNTSPSDDVLVKHQAEFLKEYLDTLTKTMQKLGCKTKAPSMAELQKSLRERMFYGIISSCSVLPLVIIDKSDARSLEEIMQVDGGFQNPAYKGQRFRKTMLRRLPEWNALGLLDV